MSRCAKVWNRAESTASFHAGKPARAVTSRFLTKLVADFDVAGEVFLN
jgi:hypothetical protein